MDHAGRGDGPGPTRRALPAGRFVDAVRVQISTSFAGKLQSRKAIEAYFSADAQHLPLRFLEADLLLGKMTG